MWQMMIQDPSGEVRSLALELGQFPAAVGRGDQVAIPLRDPTAPETAALIRSAQHWEPLSPFWIHIPNDAPPAVLGGLHVREAQLLPDVPITIAETKLTLLRSAIQHSLPTQPVGIRHWLTDSEQGKQVLWLAKKSAATPLSIYLAGETGTGKEVLAHLLHAWSDRAGAPFIPLHCGALAINLAESELFGHAKGAFTGASNQRSGALMQAHGGTLFLDEIGDLPLDIQVKLLRFLENGEIRAIGADRSTRADVRIICATHHPLEKLVEEGRFRRDLYYRLASVTIAIPPLRTRPDDIRLLARTFAALQQRMLAPKAMLRLESHAWPGNVRELRHAVERACGLAGPFTTVIGEEAFDFLLTPEVLTVSPEIGLSAGVLTMEEMERALLLRALRLSRGNRADAARILGIARSTLFVMLKRHRIIGPKSAA